MSEKLLYGWIILLSLVLLAVMGMDKAAAKRGTRRIRESTLLMLAVIGGSLGGLLGMLLFRHKTQKPAFYLGIPGIALAECLLLRLLLH